MNKPEHKRQSPWQRGKDASLGKQWTAETWNRSMAPWVKDQQVTAVKAVQEQKAAAKAEAKKRKKKNKGRKRAEWFANQLAIWRNYGDEPFKKQNTTETGTGGSSSSAAASAELSPFQETAQNSFFKQAYKKFDELLKPAWKLQ